MAETKDGSRRKMIALVLPEAGASELEAVEAVVATGIRGTGKGRRKGLRDRSRHLHVRRSKRRKSTRSNASRRWVDKGLAAEAFTSTCMHKFCRIRLQRVPQKAVSFRY